MTAAFHPPCLTCALHTNFTWSAGSSSISMTGYRSTVSSLTPFLSISNWLQSAVMSIRAVTACPEGFLRRSACTVCSSVYYLTSLSLVQLLIPRSRATYGYCQTPHCSFQNSSFYHCRRWLRHTCQLTVLCWCLSGSEFAADNSECIRPFCFLL